MTELLPVFFIGCALAWFSNAFSTFDEKIGRYRRKDYILYFILVVVLTFFVGLRTRYNDTATYIESYEYLISAKTPIFEDINILKIGGNPGFMVMCKILKHLGFSNQLFLMFFAVLTLPTYFWFVNKYTSDVFLSIYLIFTLGVYTFTLAAIKQCLAVAIALVAIDGLFKKKKYRFVILILLSSTIHPYTLLFLATPFLRFKPWTKKTYWQLVVFFSFGISLQLLMGRVIDVTSMMGKEYSAEEMSGAGVNIFRFGVCAVPLVLSYIVRRNIADDFYDEVNNTILNLSILNSLFMFVALFGTANYFGRLANYFLIFQAISIPYLLKYLNPKYKSLIVIVAIALYFVYFYYENSMLAVGYRFDDKFARVTVKEFFDTAFIFDK